MRESIKKGLCAKSPLPKAGFKRLLKYATNQNQASQINNKTG